MNDLPDWLLIVGAIVAMAVASFGGAALMVWADPDGRAPVVVPVFIYR